MPRMLVRCVTPNRCCSSTTTSARSENFTPSEIRACVPTTMSISPAASPSISRFLLADQKGDANSRAGEIVADLVVMLGGQDLGRRHDRRLLAPCDCKQRRVERHDGFSGSHVALQQAVHRPVACDVGGDLGHRPVLRFGHRERESGAYSLVDQFGVCQRVSRAAYLSHSHQCDSELHHQAFVVCDSAAGL